MRSCALNNLVLTLAVSAAVKLLAVIEWPALYRLFLFIPAQVMAFFYSAHPVEAEGIYRFPGFVLDYSCSGIHFFIVAAFLAAVLLPQTRGGFLAVLASAYILTLAANTARIGLLLKTLPYSATRPWLHEALGTVVYVSFLLCYYLVINQAINYPGRKYAFKN